MNTRDRLAAFHVRVYASNRRPETGVPLVVIAESRKEAMSRAIDLGWSGHRDDARIYVDHIDDLDPRECPCRSRAAGLTDKDGQR